MSQGSVNSFTSLEDATGAYGSSLNADTAEMEEYKKAQIAVAEAQAVEKARKKKQRQEFPLPRRDAPKSVAAPKSGPARTLFLQVEQEGCVALSKDPIETGEKTSASKRPPEWFDQEGCEEVTPAKILVKQRNLARKKLREFVKSDSFAWTKCDKHSCAKCALCEYWASETDENESGASGDEASRSGPSTWRGSKREREQPAGSKFAERKREPIAGCAVDSSRGFGQGARLRWRNMVA
tara:strand:+ start:878 stop:1591 length:714 start_codon:yes stop_codon:yes gene_type:complete